MTDSPRRVPAEQRESARRALAELPARRDTLAAEGRAILDRSDGAALSDADAAAFERVERDLDELKRQERLLGVFANPNVRIEAGSDPGRPSDSDDSRGATRHGPAGDLRDRARRTLDDAHRDGTLGDAAAGRVERLVTAGPVGSTTVAARWAVATGDPAYARAFAKLLASPDRGHMLWTPEEADAFRHVETFAGEQRALGVGSGGGGYMVPMTLDPAILLSSDGTSNPLRRIARVEQVATTSWNGVSSAGASAEWKAEAAEVADASPTLTQPSIAVHFGDAFVPYSFELGQDAPAFTSELAAVLVDAADQLQADAFVRGSAATEPKGIVTAMAAGQKVAATTADALVAADAVKLQNALPPRFQPNAQWLANLATINTLGSLETTNGALRFPEVGSGSLLRRPLNECSQLDAAGATAGAGNDEVAIYGDFRHFVIVDRIGSTLELVSHLFGTNRRPTGQRGALLWFRTGSDAVVPGAFRMLTA